MLPSVNVNTGCSIELIVSPRPIDADTVRRDKAPGWLSSRSTQYLEVALTMRLAKCFDLK